MFNKFFGGGKKRRRKDLSHLRRKKFPSQAKEEQKPSAQDDEGWEPVPPEVDDDEGWEPVPPEAGDGESWEPVPLEGDLPPLEGDLPPLEGDLPPLEGDLPPLEEDLSPLPLERDLKSSSSESQLEDISSVDISSEWDADIPVLGDSTLEPLPLPLEELPQGEELPLPLEDFSGGDLPTRQEDLPPTMPEIPLSSKSQEDLTTLEEAKNWEELPEIPEEDLAKLESLPLDEISLEAPSSSRLDPLENLEDFSEPVIEEAGVEEVDFEIQLESPEEEVEVLSEMDEVEETLEFEKRAAFEVEDDPEKTIPHRAVAAPLHETEKTAPLGMGQKVSEDPLADFLLKKGLVEPSHIQQAYQIMGRDPSKKLGPTLIELGVLTETQLTQAMAEMFSVPTVSLSEMEPDPKALKLIAPSVAERLKVLPLYFEGGSLVVAMANPFDYHSREEVKNLIPLPIQAVFAPREEVEKYLRKWYLKKEELKPLKLSKKAEVSPPVQVEEEEDSVLDLSEEELLDEVEEFAEAELLEEELEEVAEPEPVVSAREATGRREITVDGLKIPSPDTDLNILLPKEVVPTESIPAEECPEEFQLRWEKSPAGIFQKYLSSLLEEEVLEAKEVTEVEFQIICEGAG